MLKLGKSELKIGVPLLWDAFDESGNLLLRRGYLIESQSQIDALLAQGLYIQTNHHRPPVSRLPPKRDKHKENPSALTIITRELRNLDTLLKAIRGKVESTEISGKTLETARNIITAVSKERDVCLASVFFNRTTENYPLRHSLDTAIIAGIIGLSLDKPGDMILKMVAGSLTMNISMLQLQQRLLSKSEKLSEDELSKIRHHPEASRHLLERAGITDKEWLDNVLYHHEKNDGSGYPMGLREDAIPEAAKIICLADRYTATISPRTYRPGMAPNVVLRQLLIHEGDTLDITHAGVLTKVVGIYPPGMFVKLRNGETAVVFANGDDGASPVVKSILDANNNPLAFPIARQTSEASLRIAGPVRLDPDRVPFDMAKIWGQKK